MLIYELLNEEFNTVAYRFMTDIGVFDINKDRVLKDLGVVPDADGQLYKVSGTNTGLSLSNKITARYLLYTHLGFSGLTNSGVSFDFFTGDKLISLISAVKGTKRRFCFSQVESFLVSPVGEGCNVLSLFGLRNTGKTYLMYQAIDFLINNGVSLSEIAYLTISPDKTEELEVMQYVRALVDTFKVKYVFIDEFTNIKDELSSASMLSDAFLSAKFILSGNNSAGFLPLFRQYLFDRTLRISTTYISYKEYTHLFGNSVSVSDYIQNGGILRAENGYVNMHNLGLRDYGERGKNYVNTAIINNLCGTFDQSDYFSADYPLLAELYFEDKEDFKTLIFKLLENFLSQFTLRVLNRALKKSNIIAPASEINRRGIKDNRQGFENSLIQKVWDHLDMSEYSQFSAEHISELKSFLRDIDCLAENADTQKEFLVPVELMYCLTSEVLESIGEDYETIAQKNGISLSWNELEQELKCAVEDLLIEVQNIVFGL